MLDVDWGSREFCGWLVWNLFGGVSVKGCLESRIVW